MRGLLIAEGFGFAAICSNDAKAYPEDSFPKMKEFAKAHALPFPYLHDESQAVAKAYGAVCTPDFFGYDKRPQAEISRKAGRGAHDPAAERRQARASRGDARDRPHRRGAERAGPDDRLLDQMEGLKGLSAAV